MTAEFTDKAQALAFAIANGIREDVFGSRLECGWSLDRAARQPLKPPASQRRRRPRPVVELPPPHIMAQWERIAVKCGRRPIDFIRLVKMGFPLMHAADAWDYEGPLPNDAAPKKPRASAKAVESPRPRKRRV